MRNILALPPDPSERDNHIFSKRVVHIQPNGEVFRVQTGSSHWQTSGYESVGIVKNLPFGFRMIQQRQLPRFYFLNAWHTFR